MIRLLLVRHGQTAWSVERRYQGSTDIPLDEGGLRQAAALGQYFAGHAVQAIYSSDLQRAAQTAAAIGSAVGVPVTADARLRETSFGLWEGLTYRQIQERFPRQLADWQSDPMVNIPPQGESMTQLTERAAAVVRHVEQEHQGQTVVLVSHGGVLRSVLCHALALPSHVFWRMELDAASVSELHLYGDTATIALLNYRPDVHASS